MYSSISTEKRQNSLAQSMTAQTDSMERRTRIAALDILRGLAIFGILYINLPIMGNSMFGPVEWTGGSKQAVDWFLFLFVEGTQRGILQLLFGAGMLILTAKAMQPDGPVRVIDNYFRRNLWLLVFGLAHIFVLFWPYDILHVYALAALFLWPFRKMGPKAALLLGLIYCIFVLAGLGWGTLAGMEGYSGLDPKILDVALKNKLALEEQARLNGLSSFVPWSIGVATKLDVSGLWMFVLEAFCTMLIGVALFKWGILQGTRSVRFYLAFMFAAYAVGLPLRLVGQESLITVGKFALDTSELARLAVTLGHVGLVNLLLKTKIGERLLSPFKAAGRTAFSLYLLQTIIGLWILFPYWGFGLWGRLGSTGMAGLATIVITVQLILSNVWLHFFSVGPFEWLWRSLASGQRQPFPLRGAKSVAG